ncbi:glycoside hydrolase family protein [Actinocorallia libanotica]|uniref:Asl1-like glycosyl hydrolase catalytic domain-containing protein n=1 Tax=Actinocorallia libanotica TaxID=46162 RepID=A0ABN1QVD0_9ACTN
MRVPSARTKRRSLETAAVGLIAASLTGAAGYALVDRGDSRPVSGVSPQPVAQSGREQRGEEVPQASRKEGAPQETARPPASAAPGRTTAADGSSPAAQRVPQLSDKRAAGENGSGDRVARRKSCLKGVATWAFPKSKASIKNSRACWFYSWGPDRSGIAAPKGAEFVPMIHRAATIGDVAKVKGRGHRYLLGFNEPDLGDQANMSVEQALDLWPRLMGTGLVLGSPSVANMGDVPGSWLDRFMKGAKKRKLRVDFIALHWYGQDFQTGPAVRNLRDYLRRVHKRYKKPIWLTEFALTDFRQGAPRYPSQAQQAKFLRQAVKMLRKEPYLKRYAWFALPTDRSGTGLYNANGSPTPAGRAFRAAPVHK